MTNPHFPCTESILLAFRRAKGSSTNDYFDLADADCAAKCNSIICQKWASLTKKRRLEHRMALFRLQWVMWNAGTAQLCVGTKGRAQSSGLHPHCCHSRNFEVLNKKVKSYQHSTWKGPKWCSGQQEQGAHPGLGSGWTFQKGQIQRNSALGWGLMSAPLQNSWSRTVLADRAAPWDLLKG